MSLAVLPAANVDEAVRETAPEGWRFWIDRGGTFTDVVAQDPSGRLHLKKLLSQSSSRSGDAAQAAIRELLKVGKDASLEGLPIQEVRIGTTVATNALLERRGDRTLLITTSGFRDALRIGDQNRPDIFALEIKLPELLHEDVIEMNERVGAEGDLIRPLDLEVVRTAISQAYAKGFRSAAIVLMHASKFPQHEQRLGELAREIGFTQVTLSHEVSVLRKLVARGETAVQDAYLSPPLHRYLQGVADGLPGIPLRVMKSDGGLTDADTVRGIDTILSGPAAGVVACAKTASQIGFDNVVGFDMGGTSTDVCHYAGVYERSTGESHVGGARIHVPMMNVHTVAAGGGSILKFDGHRFKVGPESAGADPGPACYRRGGPLTLTDCNVLLGKLQPDLFPSIFGPQGDQPLDRAAVDAGFDELVRSIETATGETMSPYAVAEGFLRVGVDSMARAIKRVSVEKGYDLRGYALNCFGGAGAQHACLVADAVGIRTVLVHRFASVLSAYGIGLTSINARRERNVDSLLDDRLLDRLDGMFGDMETSAREEMEGRDVAAAAVEIQRRVFLKYEGTDTTIEIPLGTGEALKRDFSAAHRKQFGFDTPERALIVDYISLETIEASKDAGASTLEEIETHKSHDPIDRVEAYFNGQLGTVPVYDLNHLSADQPMYGPCIVANDISTIIVEPLWVANWVGDSHLVLVKQGEDARSVSAGSEAAPIMLEVFNNAFMSIAEQMGSALQKTARSVNIRERLDFSCAVFDGAGNLIANAPHVPVHLGSMSDAVRSVIRARRDTIRPGDVFMLNDPYEGGTHLPDITVITPVFENDRPGPIFFLASRAHHADIGGLTPGSMPSNSRHIDEEGILIRNFHLVDQSGLRESAVLDLLTSGPYPSRNPDQNLADLKAQIAANERGRQELLRLLARHGTAVVESYAANLQDYAEEQTRCAIDTLHDGHFRVASDDGSQIEIRMRIDREQRRAIVDFTGTTAQQDSNYNAPRSITSAASLYVFRTLLNVDIPLNEGCLRPVELIVPAGSMLDPHYPAAVVAGNVEVSQCITDCLYGALGKMASAQGTMNNITFGNDRYQHYETICGGAGAGQGFNGASAVHTHMTNSRLTDPEVLEASFPIVLEEFSIREGSGGTGHWHGGNGVRRRLRFREKMTLSLLANRHLVPPFGLEGGSAGACGKAWIERHAGPVDLLQSRDGVTVLPGDVFVIETPGGGGFGSQEEAQPTP